MRLYATLTPTPALLALYRGKDLDALTRFTVTLLRAAAHRPRATAQRTAAARPTTTPPPTTPATTTPPTASSAATPPRPDVFSAINAVAAPSLDWRASFTEVEDSKAARIDDVPDELVIAYELTAADHARSFLDIVNANRNVPLDADGNAFLGAGFDPGGSIADHWCPGLGNLAIFGHRRHARRTVRAHALTEHKFLGQNVNVAIIDEGLDKKHIPQINWGGGLDLVVKGVLIRQAGSAAHDSHGMMIARSILDLAPEARIYDVPVIPVSKEPLPVFVSAIQAAYGNLLHAIQARRANPRWSGPWVLVNAWGIFDTDADPSGSYTRNLEAHGHPMINLVTTAVHDRHIDIVFSAGNCGEFCPSQRCGGRDRGPGHSIWGANAHPLVITTGAVRSDETWVGYSSQGPGPESLATQKPDLCAPSQFCESDDAASLSSGSSAAAAMAAGVVAALRGNPKWTQQTVTPEAMRAALIAAARKPNGPPGWDGRLGYGIVDAAATIARLPA